MAKQTPTQTVDLSKFATVHDMPDELIPDGKDSRTDFLTGIERVFKGKEGGQHAQEAANAIMTAYNKAGKGLKRDNNGKPVRTVSGKVEVYPSVFNVYTVCTEKGGDPHYIVGRDEDDAQAHLATLNGYTSVRTFKADRVITSENIGQKVINLAMKEEMSEGDKKKMIQAMAKQLGIKL